MQLYAFDREMSHLFKKGYPLPDPTTIKIVLSKRPISKYTQKEDHSLPNQEMSQHKSLTYKLPNTRPDVIVIHLC